MLKICKKKEDGLDNVDGLFRLAVLEFLSRMCQTLFL